MSVPISDNLPIVESEQQYKAFVSSLNSDLSSLMDHPESFPKLTSGNESYLNKLNYQFLEVDSREKFLRYLNLGSVLKKDEMGEIGQQNVQLESEIGSKRQEVEQLKQEVNDKSERMIRILVKECKKRNDVVRALEGEVRQLESERTRLAGDEEEGDAKFAGKGVRELQEMEQRMQRELQEMQAILQQENERERQLAEEIRQLEQTKTELDNRERQLSEELGKYEHNEYTAEEEERRQRYEGIQTICDVWEGL